MWGWTSDGVKRTGMDARVLPRAVVYDPELCVGMPPMLAAASGMNALAHCVEALWSRRASPVTSVLAEEGIRRLVVGLPAVVANSRDAGRARRQSRGSMPRRALHHSRPAAASTTGRVTCSGADGTCRMPRRMPSCSRMRPRWSLRAAAEAMVRLQRLLDADDPAAALFDFERRLGLPGVRSARSACRRKPSMTQRGRIAELSRDDPLVPGAAAVRTMLDGAFEGNAPQAVRVTATTRPRRPIPPPRPRAR